MSAIARALNTSYPIIIASRLCIPYTIGYSLSHRQMLELAPRLCPLELVSRYPDAPDTAINHHLLDAKAEKVFLRHQEDGELRYLWVKGVVPSFNGKPPPYRILPVDYERDPALEGLGEVRGACVVWPEQLYIPEWFYHRLNSVVKHSIEKNKLKKKNELELEKKKKQESMGAEH
ncbi:hypothetical protein C8R47DRAFT_1137688 [Mycena vitilis]|nr:hypothetical protein C8R47DRAFT_1137688 [Mycena vitilis]